ncbi:recombinase family protein [Caulobacter sp. DWR2-3-1b2]|uniref:recombinase family protein n=1 Tax=Caulobacter sp. DWR2-3-1b2 TaxID=2804642 RepID=UPI003CFAD71A
MCSDRAFTRYLELKSVNALRDELARSGVLSKGWKTKAGVDKGRQPLSRGSLFHLLQSRVYLGQIVHGDRIHPGAHPAIVPAELFKAVQQQLAVNAAKRRVKGTLAGSLPLKGLVFDALGNRMGPSFAYGKNGGRHCYYVSVPLQRGEALPAGVIGRISALPMEALVLDRVSRCLDQPATDTALEALLPILRRVDVEANSVRLTLDRQAVLGDGDAAAAVSRIAARLEADDQIAVGKRSGQTIELIIGVRPVFRGGRTWMVKPAGAAAVGRPDKQLPKALAQAHNGLTKINAGPTQSPEHWRQTEGLRDSYMRRLARLAFLAPDIQRAILDGRQPAGLTARALADQHIPLAWADQRQLFAL